MPHKLAPPLEIPCCTMRSDSMEASCYTTSITNNERTKVALKVVESGSNSNATVHLDLNGTKALIAYLTKVIVIMAEEEMEDLINPPEK